MADNPQGAGDGTSEVFRLKGQCSIMLDATPPPCGACRYQKKKCSKDCVFAPYFGSDQGFAQFAIVHKVFSKYNVTRMLLAVEVNHRKDVIDSLLFEAQARINDPIYGCLSTIVALQQQVESLKKELAKVTNELQNTRNVYEGLLQNAYQQQQLQPNNMNGVEEPPYSNNSSASTNIMNMGYSNSSFDHLKMQQTAPLSNNSNPFQFSEMPLNEQAIP